MSSIEEVNDWLKDGKHFIGCFAKESLPAFPSSFPKSMIVKCDNHFVGIVLLRKQCLYFDSYGEKIIDRELIEYLYPYYEYVIFSSNVIQHERSKNCGKFCALFVQLVIDKNSFMQFINLFNLHFKILNDIIVVYLFKRIYT